MLAHEEIITPKIELRKVVKVVKYQNGFYGWSMDNLVPGPFLDTSPMKRCYLAVKAGFISTSSGCPESLEGEMHLQPCQKGCPAVYELSQDFLNHVRRDMIDTIHEMDADRGTDEDVHILQKYAPQDGLTIQIVEE